MQVALMNFRHEMLLNIKEGYVCSKVVVNAVTYRKVV